MSVKREIGIVGRRLFCLLLSAGMRSQTFCAETRKLFSEACFLSPPLRTGHETARKKTKFLALPLGQMFFPLFSAAFELFSLVRNAMKDRRSSKLA